MLPLFLDLTDRLVLVVGGGPVGRRKAKAVRAAGGKVRLVCLEARPADLDDPDIDWRQGAYADDQLEGVALVFTAATAEIDAEVARDSHRRGLWIDVASAPDEGDFHLPATVRRGDLVVAIGTGGAAPGLARRLRQRVDELLEPELVEWVRLLGEMRPMVLAITDEDQRRGLLDRLTGWEWLERLRHEGIDAVRQAMWTLVVETREEQGPPER